MCSRLSLEEGGGDARLPHPTPYTLHPTPHTLHPTPYTPHPTPYTLHPSPFTLHPTPYTLHPKPYILSSHEKTPPIAPHHRSPTPALPAI